MCDGKRMRSGSTSSNQGRRRLGEFHVHGEAAAGTHNGLAVVIVAGPYTGWWVGLVLGFIVVAVVVVIVAILLTLAGRIADNARAASDRLPVVRDQTDALQHVGHINESAISVLRSARAARKALTGS